jgi:acetyl-CoA carboxylase biotin carboxyl carrier protein
MGLTDDDVREILRIIDETPLQELTVETDGFSLHVKRSSHGEPGRPAAAADRPATTEAAGRPTTEKPRPANDQAQLFTLQAPMLGVFYRADGPSEKPFVEPGSHVEPDTTVCIIEVMKMMNSVPAGLAGTIVEVCQDNGAIVEEGAPLFRVDPG